MQVCGGVGSMPRREGSVGGGRGVGGSVPVRWWVARPRATLADRPSSDIAGAQRVMRLPWAGQLRQVCNAHSARHAPLGSAWPDMLSVLCHLLPGGALR